VYKDDRTQSCDPSGRTSYTAWRKSCWVDNVTSKLKNHD